ncbi:hypothetical protein C1H46_040436 [Malus baccata]|uniref:tRNA-intron lyase n=1 Tax=Malus baccata TaxID=106549 RepID=A0A540KII0_MALBA|nr:hypothetical protein C1H46_040436 [Malus baccata]
MQLSWDMDASFTVDSVDREAEILNSGGKQGVHDIPKGSFVAYLRTKNWVVRPGHQYGVDFVAYRHHPSLVHSEYAVLVSSEGDAEANGRLKVWSDVHCTLRLCLGVVKTLLVLTISKNGDDAASPSCLANYTVEERTVTRWSPEQSREENTTDHVESQAID